MQIKISVVTPSLNQGKYIEENILSVLNQGYKNIEHIIIDACSTDSTIDILKKYKHLNWISEPDQGQSDALNKGFNKATGDWILWLNADDMLLPKSILKYIDYISLNSKYDVIHGNMIFFKDGFPDKLKIQYFLKFNYLYCFFGIVTYPSTGTIFRSKFLKQNNLNLNFHYMMDAEWYLRCGRAIKILSVNDFFVKFRISETNKTSNHIQYGIINAQQVIEKSMIYNLYIKPNFKGLDDNHIKILLIVCSNFFLLIIRFKKLKFYLNNFFCKNVKY